MTVHDQGEGQPAIPAAPDPAQVGRPALIRGHRPRRQRLDTRSGTDGPLADLPATNLEDPLDGVLVHAQQPRHGPVAKRRLLLDERLHRRLELGLDLRNPFHRAVVEASAGHAEPSAQLADRDVEPIFKQSLTDRLNHDSSLPNRDCNFFRARSSSMASP